ncbi:recombinase family protein [Rhodococcus sp. ARC_M6]|uniref:recombinase family protein n=1 Tax=Rhodococcus sp. ARC_M6 TaxID=2928852 RepID=UPI001FB3B88B|nr:recombinase family protein [Rhodococcus sp. ARC_M6]MCJ0905481.1 recombinase family protein [Rhodococcus sp. ARC_M6]
MLFGYARVSSTEQNPAHQIDALVQAGIDAENIHTDHASGAKVSRPQLECDLPRSAGEVLDLRARRTLGAEQNGCERGGDATGLDFE